MSDVFLGMRDSVTGGRGSNLKPPHGKVKTARPALRDHSAAARSDRI
jgi:hypothetical protein